jgi:hypothetical protein
MTTTDLKIAFINVITLGFNFMQIDILLKIVLTAVASGYTLHKWLLLINFNKF